MNLEIRKETEKDYFETEKFVRNAFWNKYQPGCNEHYMVHVMRSHETWLPEFSRIALVDGKIAGLIMYFKSKIKQADGKEIQVASFGPLCVGLEYRNSGIGKKLISETLPLVKDAGYPGVLIVGEPDYYPKIGFLRCRDRGITDAAGDAWDPYMIYEFENNGMNFPGVFEEPYDITDGIPAVPPKDYEEKFEPLNRASLPCQFMYKNPSDEENGYHLRRAEEKPAVFDLFYKDSGFSESGEVVRKDFMTREFLIEKGSDEMGMCVISIKKSKPELTHIYVKDKFLEKTIEEDVCKTLEEENK